MDGFPFPMYGPPPFGWKIFHWAGNFSRALAGHPHYAFFICFTAGGPASRIIFGEQPERFDHSLLKTLKTESPAWFFYDPYGGPEDAAVSWQNLDRAAMERMLGFKFGLVDFIDPKDSRPMEFPPSWHAQI